MAQVEMARNAQPRPQAEGGNRITLSEYMARNAQRHPQTEDGNRNIWKSRLEESVKTTMAQVDPTALTLAHIEPTALTLAHIETMRAAQEARSLELAYEMQLEEALRVSAAQAQEESAHAPGSADHNPAAESSNDHLSSYLDCLSAQEHVFAEGINVIVDHKISAAMARNSKKELARSLNDAKLAKMIQEMPNEEWEDKGDWLDLPFAEGTQPPQVTLYSSGTCDAEGSGGGMAVMLISPVGDVLWQSSVHLEGLTAGVLEAKHRALVLGLEACASLGISEVYVPVDSDSVFRSVRGGTEEPMEGVGLIISQLRREVERAKAAVGNVQFGQVSRRSNRQTENLARRGYRHGKVMHIEGPNNLAGSAAEGGAGAAHVKRERDLEGVERVEGVDTWKGFAGMDAGVSCQFCMQGNKHRHEVLTLARCRHTFCLTCLEQHTQQCISHRKYPIKCAEHGCQQMLAFDECVEAVMQGGDSIAALANRNMLAKLQMESMIPENQNLYCPYPAPSEVMAQNTQPHRSSQHHTTAQHHVNSSAAHMDQANASVGHKSSSEPAPALVNSGAARDSVLNAFLAQKEKMERERERERERQKWEKEREEERERERERVRKLVEREEQLDQREVQIRERGQQVMSHLTELGRRSAQLEAVIRAKQEVLEKLEAEMVSNEKKRKRDDEALEISEHATKRTKCCDVASQGEACVGKASSDEASKATGMPAGVDVGVQVKDANWRRLSDLEGFQREVEAMKRACVERDKEISSREELLKSRLEKSEELLRSRTAEMEGKVRAREKELKSKEDSLKSKEDLLKSKEDALKIKEEAVKSKEDSIPERMNDLYKEKYAKQDAEMQKLLADVRQTKAEVRVEMDLAARDRSVAAKERVEVENMKKTNKEKHAKRKQRLATEVEKLEQEYRARHSRLAAAELESQARAEERHHALEAALGVVTRRQKGLDEHCAEVGKHVRELLNACEQALSGASHEAASKREEQERVNLSLENTRSVLKDLVEASLCQICLMRKAETAMMCGHLYCFDPECGSSELKACCVCKHANKKCKLCKCDGKVRVYFGAGPAELEQAMMKLDHHLSLAKGEASSCAVPE